jgi:hypothetical protein
VPMIETHDLFLSVVQEWLADRIAPEPAAVS